jgi:hypothetical protein
LQRHPGIFVEYSTISGNGAYFSGAADFGNELTTSEIRNSTISGNTATFRTAGISSSDGLLRVWDSTIAFNAAQNGFCGAGLITFGVREYLSLDNSIIADNTAGGGEDDLCLQPFDGGGMIGSGNLVMTSNVTLPPDTIQTEPLLGPLVDNGGLTLTHALLAGSLAIDAGHDIVADYDQRGTGFARRSGSHVDIGAFEVQQAAPPDAIFANGFD